MPTAIGSSEMRKPNRTSLITPSRNGWSGVEKNSSEAA